MLELSTSERDVLAGLMNMGVGRAAASFSAMIGEEVLLSVPSVDILSRDAAARLLAELTSGRATGISQHVGGALVDLAALVLPQAKSLQIVQAVLRHSCSAGELAELAQETLLEIGTIILNACLGTISDYAGAEIRSSLPTLTNHPARDLFVCSEAGHEADTLFLHIRFQVRTDDISGYLVFVMDMVGVERVQSHVHACLESLARGR